MCLIRAAAERVPELTGMGKGQGGGGRVWDRSLWPSHLCVGSPGCLGAGKPFNGQGRKGSSAPCHEAKHGGHCPSNAWHGDTPHPEPPYRTAIGYGFRQQPSPRPGATPERKVSF